MVYGIMVQWRHDILAAAWHRGIMAAWQHGVLACWHHGMVPSLHLGMLGGVTGACWHAGWWHGQIMMLTTCISRRVDCAPGLLLSRLSLLPMPRRSVNPRTASNNHRLPVSLLRPVPPPIIAGCRYSRQSACGVLQPNLCRKQPRSLRRPEHQQRLQVRAPVMRCRY